MPMDEMEAKEEEKRIDYERWLYDLSEAEKIARIISFDPTGKLDDDYQDESPAT